MGKVYATEDASGRSLLVRIECDSCDESIKPGPDIAESGWMKEGSYQSRPIGPSALLREQYYCPACWGPR